MSALASKDVDEEARREAARLMGSIRTEKKAAASRANGFKPGNKAGKNGGRPWKPISEVECNCTGGDSIEASSHTWRCPRGQSIRRRIKEGRDVVTGNLPPESSL